MDNPYQPPAIPNSADTTDDVYARPATWMVTAAWCYPLLVIGSLYGTWMIATLMLGRRPIPFLDDPTDIALVVDIAYFLTGVILVAFPPVQVTGVCAQLFAWHLSWLRRLFGAVSLAGVFVATVVFLRWDPLQVSLWYMD